MTREDFKRWLEYVSVTFPSFRAWMATIDDEVRKLTLDRWFGAMASVSLSAASSVVDDMLRGTVPMPRRWDEVVPTVLPRARERDLVAKELLG